VETLSAFERWLISTSLHGSTSYCHSFRRKKIKCHLGTVQEESRSVKCRRVRTVDDPASSVPRTSLARIVLDKLIKPAFYIDLYFQINFTDNVNVGNSTAKSLSPS
jgi:hypothetical protein